MANANSKDFKVSWAGVDITAQVLGPITFAREGAVEDVTPYGASDQVQAYAGMNKLPDITLEFRYDDTAATGEDAVFNNPGASAALVYTWRTGKTSTLTGTVKSYQRIAGVGKVTRARAVIAQSGPVVET